MKNVKQKKNNFENIFPLSRDAADGYNGTLFIIERTFLNCADFRL